MFDRTSRYYDLPKLSLKREDGRVVTYAGRRFIPPQDTTQTLVTVKFEDGGRLDNVTAATLGAPELYWRICDANGVRDPAELEVPGGAIKVPVPGSQFK